MNSESLMHPLCVDLDGTLIHSDLLLESFLQLCKRNPLYLLLVPVWLLQGKAVLKAEIAKRVQLNPVALPYNAEFLRWLRERKEAGRVIWLCTASNFRLANLVSDHLMIFQGVLASTDRINMSGSTKARHLVEKFGERGFDYCGNHAVDKAIWENSQDAVVVNGSERLAHQAALLTAQEEVLTFSKKAGLFRPMLRALRLHQWAKNALIFVPLIAAHKVGDIASLKQAIMAFFAFGLCASSVYLLNDMLDLEVDRLHAKKRHRPFASGELPLIVGFALIPLLLAGAILFASPLPFKFWITLSTYYALTVAYSFGLKSIVLVDTIALAGLYTVRIVAGAKAIAVPLSFWLLLLSVFLFLSLALVKRYAELDALQRQGKLKAAGRGYHVEDLPILHSMGVACGFLCVLVLAQYINSPEVLALYRTPQVIWFLCVLLLFWISRIWLITHRGDMHDDPVVFAMKDRVSLIVGVLVGVTVMLAT
jgi:4-hydroxybenzoate polyprenyltransferase